MLIVNIRKSVAENHGVVPGCEIMFRLKLFGETAERQQKKRSPQQ